MAIFTEPPGIDITGRGAQSHPTHPPTHRPPSLPQHPVGTLPQYRIEVLCRVPTLKKLDGQPVEFEEMEAAKAAAGGGGRP